MTAPDVVALYLAVDAGSPAETRARTDAVGQVRRLLHEAAAADRAYADRLRIAVVELADAGRVVAPLSPPSEVCGEGRLDGERTAGVAPSVAWLRATIGDDVRRLRHAGHAVARPVVALMTGRAGRAGGASSLADLAAAMAGGDDETLELPILVPCPVDAGPTAGGGEGAGDGGGDGGGDGAGRLDDQGAAAVLDVLAALFTGRGDGPDAGTVAHEAGTDMPVIGAAGRSGGIVGASSTRPSIPDSAIDAVDLPSFAVRAASCRGRSHRFAGSRRQDAYACTVHGPAVVAAVADGVGSGPRSDLAARVAVESATQLLVHHLDAGGTAPVDWAAIGSAVAAAVVSAARTASDPPPEADAVAALMSTTLLAAVVVPGDDGGADVALGWIGDTSAWLLRSGRWASVTPVKNEGADVASSKVAALPLHAEPATGQLAVRPGDALFLMSDGVGDAMGSGAGEVPDRLAALWSAPPPMHTFGAQVDFQRRSFDDDRTVVGLWLPPW